MEKFWKIIISIVAVTFVILIVVVAVLIVKSDTIFNTLKETSDSVKDSIIGALGN